MTPLDDKFLPKQFDGRAPIYVQIAEAFQRAIARGELKPGDRVPAVRELAGKIVVNPNTVQRTYQELEQMGLLVTRRGLGTFVTDDTELLQRVSEQLARTAAETYLREMAALGYSPGKATRLLAEIPEEPDRKRGGDAGGRTGRSPRS